MDLPIRSPWLHQLNRKRPAVPLEGDVATDIAIIGGGIAGIATAYFLIRDTEKRVALIEADQVAHGATGHNAGQLVAEFERSFGSLVRQFGMEMAARGHRDVKSAWDLLEQIRDEMNIQTPVWRVTGYVALSDPAQVMDYLADSLLRTEAELPLPRILVSAEWQPGLQIPAKYEGLYEWVPQADILALLETADTRYVGIYEDPRGCMNSAVFCEELMLAMLSRWPDRLRLYEMTPVKYIVLRSDHAEMKTEKYTIRSARVVLCTNGFENLHIANEHGADLDTKYHEGVRGKIGYMAAFMEPQDHPPAANLYHDKPGIDPEQPYFYITRRPYDLGNADDGRYNLISVGGPETDLPEDVSYERIKYPYQSTVHEEIDAFLRRTYRHYRPSRTEDAFFWHGLMAYTRTGVRLIGPEPCNPILMYNLGCNGIGLLHSIYGGYKIAQIVLDKPQEPSMFDPQDTTCLPAQASV